MAISVEAGDHHIGRIEEGVSPMKRPVAIVALFLGVTTALPAFAAPIVSPELNRMPQASVETVQYRPVPLRYRVYRPYAYRPYAYRYPGAYGAYAYGYPGYGAYAAGPRRITPWGHCVSRIDRGTASAYPSWDVC
jgi:hypothetical protein